MYPVVQDRKIRVGIVGCGRISKNHFGSVDQHADDMELAAVCDIDAATLQAHRERYRVPGYVRMEDMLKSEKLDLVALCTPSGLHPDQAIMAAGYGVNVMTEKPMARPAAR